MSIRNPIVGWGLVLSSVLCAAGTEKPIVDNERVKIWDITWDSGTLAPAEASAYDTVEIYLAGDSAKEAGMKGQAFFIRKGEARPPARSVDGKPARSILIELKDHPVPPLENKSGHPNAFPRPHVRKVLENSRVIVWSYAWTPGEPTPVHYHDKDVVVVYMEDTALTSTTPDGKKVLNEYKSGETRFNLRDRTHTELLARGTGSAVMMELK